MAAALSLAAAHLPASEWGPLPVRSATWPHARTVPVPSPRRLELAATEPQVPPRRWPRWPLAVIGVSAAVATGLWIGDLVRPGRPARNAASDVIANAPAQATLQGAAAADAGLPPRPPQLALRDAGPVSADTAKPSRSRPPQPLPFQRRDSGATW
jgi:hypothetical protein